MDLPSMTSTAHALVAPGKGILAADESTPTMAKRLAGIGVESTEPRRRAYRELLFTTDGLAEHISGVILFDETARQVSEGGVPFPELLRDRGIVPGIKVDRGTKPLAGFPDDLATEGLDELRERLDEYAGLGLKGATARLDVLNRTGPQPWELSFSFGRALQAPVLRAWAGDPAHGPAAQTALLERARLNGAARRGAYTEDLEPPYAGGDVA